MSRAITIRIDEDVKRQAEETLDEIGLSMTSYITSSIKALIRTKRVPFEMSAVSLTENGFTPEFEDMLLNESEKTYKAVADGTAVVYDTPEALFSSWENDK